MTSIQYTYISMYVYNQKNQYESVLAYQSTISCFALSRTFTCSFISFATLLPSFIFFAPLMVSQMPTTTEMASRNGMELRRSALTFTEGGKEIDLNLPVSLFFNLKLLPLPLLLPLLQLLPLLPLLLMPLLLPLLLLPLPPL